MATRDFKIRTGLVVTGNTEFGGTITIGGSTVSKLLDSDNITAIINSTVTGLADSDLKAIGDLRNDVDSDSIAIQALGTTVGTLSAKVDSIEAGLDSETARIQLLLLSTDSDALSIAGLKQEADSDAAAIAELLRQADSDATAIQALNTTLTADIAAINSRLDSDEIQLQAVQTDLETAEGNITTIQSDISAINAKLDSDETALQVLDTKITALENAPGAKIDSDNGIYIEGTNILSGNTGLPNNLTATNNILIGENAGNGITHGDNHIVIGKDSAPNITTAGNSVVIGVSALTNGTGNYSTAVSIGYQSGATTGGVSVGYRAGGITTAGNGVLLGNQAGYNSSGSNPIAIGQSAMSAGGSGGHNIGIGASAAQNMTTGQGNIAVGQNAGNYFGSGNFNLAFGYYSLSTSSYISGSYNIAAGFGPGQSLTSGEKNIILGFTTGGALTTGSNNVLIGSTAGRVLATSASISTGSNNIAIGNNAPLPATDGSNVLSIGDSEITRLIISGLTLDTADASNGQILSWNSSTGGFDWTYSAGITDSDLKSIADLRNDVDSDSIVIQSLQTQLNALDTGDIAALRADADSDSIAIQAIRTAVDSDYSLFNAKIALFNGLTDSDLSAVAKLRDDVDSDSIAIQALGTRIDNLGGSQSISVTAYTFTSPANDSDFTGTDDNGKTLSYVVGKIHVYLNGILLTNTSDYIATDGSTVTLINAPDSDDILTVVKYLGTVQAGFDSDQVVGIINENVVTDPTINTRLDSDSAKLQAIQTTVDGLSTSSLADSDVVVITGAKSLTTNQIIGGSVTDVDTFATSLYRSVKYVVVASSDSDSTYQADEILVVHDGTTAYMTQYAQIATADSELVTYDVTISSSNVVLQATPTRNNVRFDAQRLHVSVANNSILNVTISPPDWSTLASGPVPLLPPVPGANDAFGLNLNMNFDGSYAVIGAYSDDDNGSAAGAAFVYTRTGSSWALQQKITPSDAGASDYFGYDVALNDDATYLIAGARLEDGGVGDPINQCGTAYIFTRSGSTWTQQSRLDATDAASGNRQGYSVAINSDATTAATGGQEQDSNSGAVYVFTRSGSTWTQQAKLQPDAGSTQQFGNKIVLSKDGNYLLVGAKTEPGDGGNPLFFAGTVYVFSRSGSTWTKQTKLVSSDLEDQDNFGYSISINHDASMAVIGAPEEDGGAGDPTAGAGAAYVFTRSGSTWTQQAKIVSSEIQAADEFGNSVSFDSDADFLTVGAWFEQGGSGDPVYQQGAVYVFSRDNAAGSSWTEENIIRLSDGVASDQFGQPVSMSKDGRYLLVGAPMREDSDGAGTTVFNAGAAYVYEAS